MKVMLIVFMVFQFDGGATHSEVQFESMKACEAARAKLIDQDLSPDRWGRPRMIAVCVKQS